MLIVASTNAIVKHLELVSIGQEGLADNVKMTRIHDMIRGIYNNDNEHQQTTPSSGHVRKQWADNLLKMTFSVD